MRNYLLLFVSFLLITTHAYAGPGISTIAIQVPESVAKSGKIETNHLALSMIVRENETALSINLGIPRYHPFLKITETQAKKLGFDLYQLAKDIQSKKISIYIYD